MTQNRASGLNRFLGVSLSGGKTEKTSTVQLDFYPEQNRLFLSELQSKILFESGLSSDEHLIQWALARNESYCLVFDVPISLPTCFSCDCSNTHGPEYCPKPEVQWMLEITKSKRKRPARPITPYTQRALDLYLSEYNGGKFDVGHALGSNLASLTVRARFLTKRIPIPSFEIQPRVVSFILGLNFGVSKSKLHALYLSSQGEEARELFIKQMVNRTGIFIYKQDLCYLSENYHAFNSLLCAYMGFLHYQKLVVSLPELLSHEACLLPQSW